MKMRKRILGCLVAATLMMTQVICVGAAGGSKGSKIDLTEGSKKDGYTIDVTDKNGDDFVNEKTPEAKDDLGNKKPVTPVIKIDGNNANKVPSSKDPNKEVFEVTIYLPSLNKDLLDSLVDYYYWGDDNWGIGTYTRYDLDASTVTFEFEELPVWLVLYADALAESEAAGVSPQTGVRSDWALWLSCSVVLFGAAFVMTRKKNA